MVERRITVLAALLIGMYLGNKGSNDTDSIVPPMSDEFSITSLCGLGSNQDSSYGYFIRPAVYFVSGVDLPDPFDFYTISSDVGGAVQNIVKQGVLSEQGLDEIGKRRYALGLLDFLDVTGDWTIDSFDFEYLQRQSFPIDEENPLKASYISDGFSQ